MAQFIAWLRNVKCVLGLLSVTLLLFIVSVASIEVIANLKTGVGARAVALLPKLGLGGVSLTVILTIGLLTVIASRLK